MPIANIKKSIANVIHQGPKKDLLYLFSISNLAREDQTRHFLVASTKSKKKITLFLYFFYYILLKHTYFKIIKKCTQNISYKSD